MNSLRKQSGGFSLIEGVLVFGVLILIGFLGWTFYQTVMTGDTKLSADTSSTESQPEQNMTKTDSDGQPSVESTADLDDAEKFLNSTDVDKELDTSTIDKALDS